VGLRGGEGVKIKFKIHISLFLGLIFALSSCENSTEEPPPTPIPVVEYSNETSFDTVYPSDWVETILGTGFLIFSPVDVAYEGVPGPSLTVRMIPPGFSAPTLEEDFDRFLKFGPLRGDYAQNTDIQNVKVGQYRGLRVEVERKETDEFIAMKGVIVAVWTENTTVYYFIATAPTEIWDLNWPKMQAILQNLTFYD
jgi:hypothetical protein